MSLCVCLYGALLQISVIVLHTVTILCRSLYLDVYTLRIVYLFIRHYWGSSFSLQWRIITLELTVCYSKSFEKLRISLNLSVLLMTGCGHFFLEHFLRLFLNTDKLSLENCRRWWRLTVKFLYFIFSLGLEWMHLHDKLSMICKRFVYGATDLFVSSWVRMVYVLVAYKNLKEN